LINAIVNSVFTDLSRLSAREGRRHIGFPENSAHPIVSLALSTGSNHPASWRMILPTSQGKREANGKQKTKDTWRQTSATGGKCRRQNTIKALFCNE
jgi:hypothetical protein